VPDAQNTFHAFLLWKWPEETKNLSCRPHKKGFLEDFWQMKGIQKSPTKEVFEATFLDDLGCFCPVDVYLVCIKINLYLGLFSIADD
jgi:hypothetical protein